MSYFAHAPSFKSWLLSHPRCDAAALLLALALATGCHDSEPLQKISADLSDSPIQGLRDDELAVFHQGDAEFETPFRDAQGLGPVYIRHSCNSCHADDAKGPGVVHKMVVMQGDGITPAADQSPLVFGPTIRNQVAGTAKQGIDLPPDVANIKVSKRIAPAVFGRGYMEAVGDREIERLEREQSQRSDGISGRINRVPFQSQANVDTRFHAHVFNQPGLIGRFGLKGRIATLDDFTADAMQGDMGITTPMRPEEAPMPEGIADGRPGIDSDFETLNVITDYIRTLAIPTRTGLTDDGAALFEQTQCSACHVPTLRTRGDYPIAALADQDAPIFTDMLLHDMGIESSDGMVDMQAAPSEWKTAPLIGLRFFSVFLHDGRATTLDQAIRLHRGTGSEANGAVDAYEALAANQRQTLVDYVSRL